MSERNLTAELRKLRRSSAVPSKSSAESLSSILKKMYEDVNKLKPTLEKTTVKGSDLVKNPPNSNTAGNGVAESTVMVNNPVELPDVSEVVKSLTEAYSPKKTVSEGARIKSSITNILKPKYGEIGTKGLFDNISDEDIEKSAGLVMSDALYRKSDGEPKIINLPYYPNLRDGLTLFYAASDKGDKRAAKMAYEAAYTEGDKIVTAYRDEDTSDGKFTSFYEDYQKNQNNNPKNISDFYSIVRASRKYADDELGEMKKIIGVGGQTESYYDFTSNGSGLDAEYDPTPLEAAQMAAYVYDAMTPGEEVKKEEENAVGEWKWTDLGKQNEQGLDIGVFEKQVNGKTTYVVVNAGSETKLKTGEDRKEFVSDWSNNLQQPFGKSQDMEDSIKFAEKFVKEHPDANIIFVGHSKGGAEAAANAVATGKKAILFNPASVNLGAYDLNSDDYDGDMTAYVVDGEILNNIFGDISTPIDKLEVINKESVWEKIFKKASPAGSIFGLIDGFKNHSIESVIDGLQN